MMVQTVTGPIPLDRLGRTLMHEHLFIAFPGAEFDPTAKFDRAGFIAEAVRRLVQLRNEHGVRSFVDPCPIELGRDVTVMKEISEKSGMHIICTTGFYFEEMGLPVYWRTRTVEEIAELYIREISHGIGETGIKAGAIKVATGAPRVTELEKKFLAAACIAQKATGVPIITHTQDGCAGPEQQKLFADGGVGAVIEYRGHEPDEPVGAGGDDVLADRDDDVAAAVGEEDVARGPEAELGGSVRDDRRAARGGAGVGAVLAGRVEHDDLERPGRLLRVEGVHHLLEERPRVAREDADGDLRLRMARVESHDVRQRARTRRLVHTFAASSSSACKSADPAAAPAGADGVCVVPVDQLWGRPKTPGIGMPSETRNRVRGTMS